MDEDFEVTGEMLYKRPEMTADGYKVGDSVKCKVLHAKYSRYMQKIGGENPVYLDTFAELLYMQGQYRHAFAAIRRALELEPENSDNWSYLQ